MITVSLRTALVTAFAIGACCLSLGVGEASAIVNPVSWEVHSFAAPTNFSAQDNPRCEKASNERCDLYEVIARDSSDGPSDGSAVTVSDLVPAGLAIRKLNFQWSGFPVEPGVPQSGPETNLANFGLCTQTPGPSGTRVECRLPTAEFALPNVQPDDTFKLLIEVTVTAPTSSPATLTNVASASGGGGQEATTTTRNTLEGPTPSFGLENSSITITGAAGEADTTAGGHPYELTTAFELASEWRERPDEPGQTGVTSVEDVKDVVVDLPIGFLGSALATPTCTFAQLTSNIGQGVAGCPTDTVVGHISTVPKANDSVEGAIYNLTPEHGVAAEFGFVDSLAGPHVLYASVVPTPAGYVLRTTAPDISQISLTRILVTFFGDPAAFDESSNVPAAFFTNPSQCTGKELTTSVHLDSWQHPGREEPDEIPDFSDSRWAAAQMHSPAITGCNSLRFTPTLFLAQPETTTADAATGLDFDLQVPQNEDPQTLATPSLKNATVKLPAGLIVNPASAGGLAACSPAQIGWLGGGASNFTAQAPSCPDPSKIGSVKLTSPLLAGTLVGSVYLASEHENPFGSLLAGYIVVNDPTTGVIVKIAGRLETDPSTGQITGVFDENPELPFSDLKLHFFGGTRGELATPETCGTFTATGAFASWSATETEPEANLNNPFSINSNCTPGFTPAFAAGTTNAQAGGYQPFVLTFSRQDTEQELSGLTVSLPAGLTGKLAGISECTNAQLAAAAANPSGAAEQANPECPANSRIGTVESSAGVGSEPFTLGGTAYLTGPYKGAPFGIAVVVPALAGPFDLGNVVVRSKLNVDPNDAHVTVTSDPFPTVVDAKGAGGHTDGFPIRLRSITVTMDRPQFTLNPTSCEPATINATLTSTLGPQAPVSSRFQAEGCSELAFRPSFVVTTAGKTSKANGASLVVRVASVQGQANIGKVDLQLPKQLPARLTTLQKACTEVQFNTNPAGCPVASVIGTAKAITPLLADPLVGPAYLVSHGGAAFPDVEFLLQGDNVMIELDGKTQIKKGITYSRFETVPDAPISSFETVLPQGKYSVLATDIPASAQNSLCGLALSAPTVLTGHNGAVVNQATKVGVTGCAKQKSLTRAQKLANALKACKKKAKQKRAACNATARKRYGTQSKKKANGKRGA
jgi:hypothetical protein